MMKETKMIKSEKMKTVNNKLSAFVLFSLLLVAGATVAKGDVKNSPIKTIEVTPESGLSVESWMVDENLWNSGGASNQIEPVQEIEMAVEEWMVNETIFGNASVSLSISSESRMEIENWMVDETRWGNGSSSGTEESDSKIQIESWMLENSNWNYQEGNR